MAQPAVEKVTVFSIANPEHAIASLRLITPLSEAGIEISWRMPNQEYNAQMISGSDLVIIQRDFPRFVDQYIQIHLDAHRLGIPVIFEIDDLLWELPEEHPDRATNHYTDALLPMMFAALASDGITVSSTGIKQYLSWLNPNIFVLPNYLNLKLWSFQTPEPNLGDTISIGYMGGDSHLPDLQMVEIVILDILESYQGRVKFINWGLQPPPALNEHPLVEWKSLTPGNYATFAKHFNQHHLDIYIAPLKNSLFNRSKSSIKIIEYTTLGIPGVSSDLDPYSSVINPGVTGFLAETTEQWEAHLRTLIDQPDIRNQISRQAQESVRNDWLISDHFYQWQQVYESIVGSYSPRQDVPKILQLMNSIIAQTTVEKKQLKMKLEDQQAQLLQLKESRSWQAGQVLRSIFNRLFSRKQKRSVQEALDES
jgi:glycosyltransferase involved in cell wall biosynthesis